MKIVCCLLLLGLFVMLAEAQAQFVVSAVVNNQGVEVAFPIILNETKNETMAFSGFLELSYDPTLLTFQRVKTGELSRNFLVNSTDNSKNYLFWKANAKQGICRIIFASAEPLSKKGVLAEMVFTASLQAPAGKLIGLNIEKCRFNEVQQSATKPPGMPGKPEHIN